MKDALLDSARLVISLLAVAMVFCSTRQLNAIALHPGDIIVGDQGPWGTGPGSPKIIHLDPRTGTQTILASSGLIQNPWGLRVVENEIVVTDTPGGIYRVDPAAGAQTAVRQSVDHYTRSFAVSEDGELFVAGRDGVSRVDPLTGATRQITFGGALNDPMGIAIDHDGSLVVGNFRMNRLASNTDPVVVRIDPFTGVQTTVSMGEELKTVGDLTLAADGTIVAVGVGLHGGGVYTVDPKTGSQTVLSSGGLLVKSNCLFGLAMTEMKYGPFQKSCITV